MDSEIADYSLWTPVSHDGYFFEQNAKEKYLKGDVPTHITYIVGTNSFEGMVSNFTRKIYQFRLLFTAHAGAWSL